MAAVRLSDPPWTRAVTICGPYARPTTRTSRPLDVNDPVGEPGPTTTARAAAASSTRTWPGERLATSEASRSGGTYASLTGEAAAGPAGTW